MSQLTLFEEDRVTALVDRLGLDGIEKAKFEVWARRYWTDEVMDKLELELWYMKGLI